MWIEERRSEGRPDQSKAARLAYRLAVFVVVFTAAVTVLPITGPKPSFLFATLGVNAGVDQMDAALEVGETPAGAGADAAAVPPGFGQLESSTPPFLIDYADLAPDINEAEVEAAVESGEWIEPTIESESRWADAGNGVRLPDVLIRIRFCESTNNYGAANTGSSARGAYQFLTKSWEWYGHAERYGVAAAHLATPAQQDEAALITFRQSGARPWAESRWCWDSDDIPANYASAIPATTTTSPAPADPDPDPSVADDETTTTTDPSTTTTTVPPSTTDPSTTTTTTTTEGSTTTTETAPPSPSN